MAHFFEPLASFSRLIRFDKRGTGLSDRPVDDLPDLETRMDDMRAVLDAVGSERAMLFGYSEGGPMCCLFAATYPDRTSALVLYGTLREATRSRRRLSVGETWTERRGVRRPRSSGVGVELSDPRQDDRRSDAGAESWSGTLRAARLREPGRGPGR